MSRSALALVVLLLAAPADAGAVEAQLVTRSGKVYGPQRLSPHHTRVHGCAVRARSPLAVLAALDRRGAPSFRTRGECSALYVFQVGRERERGAGGWVYKLNHRIPSVGAADPSVRVRASDRVTWFWCRQALRCQRTLEVQAPARVAAGETFSVTVRAYDDRGRSVPAKGARVGGATAGADGVARLTAPGEAGPLRLTATKRGLVPAFPEVVTVR
jgi:hypothetical protein